MNPAAERGAWADWYERCAFGLLEKAAKAGLEKVVGDRFRSRVKRLNAYGGDLPYPVDRECAHLFETWCALHDRRDGKRYKDWLMTRGQRDLDTIQSGIMLLVRNVVREWVRQQHAAFTALSLDEPLPEASGRCLRELLPAERTDDSAEWSRWQTRQAHALIKAAQPVDLAVLEVRAEGRVFSHPQVRADTGYGKTALHNAHRRILKNVAEDVKAEFPGLDTETASQLVLSTLDQASQLILKEKKCGKPGNTKLRGFI
jgi:hypothetical protein